MREDIINTFGVRRVNKYALRKGEEDGVILGTRVPHSTAITRIITSAKSLNLSR